MSDTRNLISLSEASRPFFVGVDLGGTNIKAGVVDDQGRPLSWHSVSTHVEEGPEAGAKRLADSALRAIREAGLHPQDILSVGLGSPGTMDIRRGMLLEPPNLKGWEQFPLVKRVSENCGLPVAFENDANAAAYGEFWVGSARDYNSMVMFTLGTGVGGGIVLNGEVLDGENSHGGELGHLCIDYGPNARICGCGQPGHLEAYASATGLVGRAREALQAGRDSRVNELLAEGQELTPLLLAEQAEAGDEFSLEMILETASYLARGIVLILHTVDPEAIVLGGAMTFGRDDSSIGRRFLERIYSDVRRFAFPLLAKRIVIRYASLGGDAGFIGAAGISRSQWLRKQKH